ncbi:FBD-associated F-box protein [Rhynchospora pubera]|uniref:FBD-associated F-box protein n=1 Tax=Rhynchospora pubera TaxID=906938 RepID=A0AAV8FZV3_9POAL|nr:FBD-associated F-box protein [Rhynchospora pubera]KAJ4798772.1 FBD-associated F-box protein [Rhynchospora pubera]
MYSLDQLYKIFKGTSCATNSTSLIILTIILAGTVLLYKKMLVALWPHFSIGKKKLSNASSTSKEEDISGSNIMRNRLECIRSDTSDADIIGNLPEYIKKDTSGANIICNLPECIKHKILVYLPINEAVRTSILSKSWQHIWCTIPDLVVDCNINRIFYQNIGDKEESMDEKFVNQLFSCHKGNLHKFKFSGLKSGMVDTASLMQILSQKQINELILEASPDDFVLVSGINLCLKLKLLMLSRCFIYLPVEEFDGFRLLHTVDLKDCSFLQKGITELVSLCPLLEKLKFKALSSEDDDIQIHAPNLRELTICGKFAQVSLVTPNLCTINFVRTFRTVGLRGNFIRLPICINDILCYDGFCYFLQKHPPTLNYLTMMIMILEPTEHQIHFANLSFRRVPMLQKLIIYLEPIKPLSSAYKIQDKILPCLREATIIPFRNSEAVLEFAEYILSCSAVLQRLTIRGDMKDCEVSKLNKISKLSTKTEIIFTIPCFSAEGKFEGCCCSMCNIVAG